MAKIKLGFLIDPSNNWIGVNLNEFIKKSISKKKFLVKIETKEQKLINFDIVFIINYSKIIKESILNNYKIPLIIHASDLPKGRGFAPMIWQILNNKNEITVSLFKASKNFDEGNIIYKIKLKFDGTELYNELREKLSEKIFDLISHFLNKYPKIKYYKQKGKPTYFKKRTPSDSEININKSIKSQFNLLRVCNNELWPAFFKYKRNTYIIKIKKK